MARTSRPLPNRGGLDQAAPVFYLLATLRSGSAGAELLLDDTNGRPRVEIGSSGITIRDETGRLVWKSPKMGFLPATAE